jgi:hypothetical protein
MRYFHTQEDLKWALDTDLLDVDALLVHLSQGFYDSSRSTCESLRCLATAADVYKLLPGATVAIEVVSSPIRNCQWASSSVPQQHRDIPDPNPLRQSLYALFPFKLTRGQAFACVAYFESGNHNIQPPMLSRVMAMSSGDSIFVAAQLICDPYEPPQKVNSVGFWGMLGERALICLSHPTPL